MATASQPPQAEPPPGVAPLETSPPETGARGSRPNLLLIFPDEWRWDYAGFDPSEADLYMPNLRGLAERGTRFSSAYSPSPWCAPSRACLASARFFDRSPKVLNGMDYPLRAPTWYQELRKAGYHVIITGKDDLTQSIMGTWRNGARHADALGADDWFRMQDKYVTYRRSPWDQFGVGMQGKPCGLVDSGKTNLYSCNDWCYGMFGRGHCCKQIAHEGYDCPGFDQVGANQEDYIDNYIAFQSELLLDRAPADKPWVLHVSFPGPHPPFVITQAMNESMVNREFKPSRDNQRINPQRQQRIRKQYAAEIENLDGLFGRLLAKVEARGEAENTLVVITSDHGEQLGDQNVWGKKKPWEPSIRVPLVVSGPSVAMNRTVDLPVSTLDVIGTFLERAGVSLKGQEAESLDPLLRGGLPPDEVAYLQKRPHVHVGLSYPGGGKKDPAVDFRAVIRRVNDTVTLKVICCPRGCPHGNTHVPSTAPNSQFLAFNVASREEHDIVNLNWTLEAYNIAAALPGKYATACVPPYPPTPEPRGVFADVPEVLAPVKEDSLFGLFFWIVLVSVCSASLLLFCCQRKRCRKSYNLLDCNSESAESDESEDDFSS